MRARLGPCARIDGDAKRQVVRLLGMISHALVSTLGFVSHVEFAAWDARRKLGVLRTG